MAQLTATPDTLPQNARVRDVEKPPAGQTVLVPVTSQEVLNFKFPISQVRIVLKDIDVYLIFQDGSQIVLPGLGIELSLDPAAPRLVFDTELVLTQDFFARIGPVQTDDEYKAQVMQSVTGTGSVTEEVPNDNISRVPPQPQGQQQTEFSSQSPIVLPPPVVTAGSGAPPLPISQSTSSRSSTASADFTSNNAKPEDGQIIKDLDIAIYTASQSSTSTNNGVNVIKHGFGPESGAPPASGEVGDGATARIFNETDNVEGSSGSDRIYPEDYPLLNVRGFTAAIARIAIKVDAAEGTTGVLRFTVPSNYIIVPQNGLRRIDARTYEVDATVADGKLVTDIEIGYKVPTGELAPDANGFYDRGSIAIRFIEDTTDGKSTEFSTQFLVGIRDVNNQSDLTYKTAGTNQTVYVLPSAPNQNSVSGGSGDDTIFGGGGKDTIDGGSGTDTVSYEWSGAAVSVALGESGSAAVVGSTGFARGDVIINVENLAGSDFADTLTGNSENNSLSGGLGNDSLTGGGGADTLSGDAGTNVLAGGADNDVYTVTSANDRIIEAAGEGDDTVLVSGISSYTLSDNVERMTFTGTGRFTGTGSSVNNIITGGSSENSLAGMAGADTLIGGAAADTLDGGTGADSMAGGAGDDAYIVDDLADVIDETSVGSGGFDTVIIRASGMNANGAAAPVSYTLPGGVERLIYEGSADATLAGSADANTIVGGSGHNLLRGLGGSDSLVGGVQADTLEGGTGPGADSLAGGAGDDVYIIDDPATVIIGEDAQTSIDTIRTTISNYALGTAANVAVENLVFTGTGPFTGTGSDAANSIVGGSDANSLSGGAGDDTLIGSDVAGTLDGGSGSDSLVGGRGNDSYVVDSLDDVVREAAGTDVGGIDTAFIAPISLSGYTLNGPNSQNIENLTNLGSAAFTGIGSDVANVLTAGTGDNSMFGAGGNDSIVGLDGNDTLDGGDGDDTILGGRGGNVLAGGDGNDSLVGGADSETMTGGAGADTLVSGGAGALAGSESLAGGTGDDIYVLENVNQNSHAVVIDDTSGIDTIRTNATAWDLRQDNNTTVENLTFTGAGASGTGNVLANVITGGTGNDTLQAIANTNGIGGDTLLGGDGNDSLMAAGGSAGDRLEGGTGADTLVGSDAASTLLGGSDADRLLGGSGNESLDGGTGADTIDAGGGNDTIDDASGADSIFGGSGSDRITVYATDTADGGADDDTFTLTTANASIAGNTGTDEIVINGPLDGTTRTFSLATATSGIEKLTVTGSAAFTLAGDAGVNTITGGSGDDSLSGGGGNDSLNGGLGNDTLSGAGGALTLQGGGGNDLYRIDSSTDVILEGSGAPGGNDTISTSLLNYSMGNGNLNVEVLRYEGNATVAGGAGFTAQGDNGDQTVIGTRGNDLVDGGLGSNDAVVIDYTIQNLGALGPKIGTYVVDGVTRDLYAFNAAFQDGGNLALTQNKTQVSFSSAGTGNDTLSGVEYVIVNNAVLQVQLGVTNYGDQGTGNPFSTTTLGTIVTNDTMNGTVFPDNLFGGQGNDTYLLNNASDTVGEGRTVSGSVVDSGGIDTILLTGSAFTNAGGVATFDMGPNNTQNFVPIALGASTTNGVENLTLIGSMAASITGNELNNSIIGNNGLDTLSGGDGNDTLDGGAGADSFVGGRGNDLFILDNVNDRVGEDTGTFANGNDSLWVRAGGTYDLSSAQFANVENAYVRDGSGTVVGGNFTLLGSTDRNVLHGGLGNDSLSGGDGNDTLVALGGNDTMDGGVGNDVYVIDADYSQPGRTLVINELSGAANGTADELRTTRNVFDMADTARFGSSLANIEILRFVGADYASPGVGSFTGAGSAGANTIFGGDGADSLVGGGGNDSLSGGNSADTLDGAFGDNNVGGTADTMAGGSGNDWYTVNSTFDSITGEQVGAGADRIDTIQIVDSGLVDNAGNTIASTYSLGASYNLNVENLVYNGALAFTLGGSADANSIQGGSGNDSITGGAGADTLAGGRGDDNYLVDDNADVVIENAGEGADTIRLAGATAFSLATNGVKGNAENLINTLNVGASMQGNDGANSILGNNSADTLDGNGGADTLAGFSGDDYYIVDSSDDVVVTDSGGIDTVELRYNPSTSLGLGSLNTVLPSGSLNLAGIENLIYTGLGAVSVVGGSAANVIAGNDGDDRINGNLGADTLRGGKGNDAYWIDAFSPAGATAAGDVVIENLGEGADTIYGTLNTVSGAQNVIDLGSGWYNNVEALAFVFAPAGTPYATTPAGQAFTGVGNALDNTIVGGNGANSLGGAGGSDSLFGGTSNDTLDGGSGADTMRGNAGNDTYVVDSVGDVVLESGLTTTGAGTDTILVYGSSTLNTFSLADPRWAGVENLTFSGAAGVATTTGFSGSGNFLANVITGSNGNDTLTMTVGGADTLAGGDGNDVLRVDSSADAYFGRIQAPLGSTTATTTGFATSLGNGTSAVTLGATFLGNANFVQIGNVRLNWSGSSLTFTVFNAATPATSVIYTWTVNQDGAPHTLLASYAGSGSPILSIDGIDYGTGLQSSGTPSPTFSSVAAGTLLINSSGSAFDGLDNVRIYDVALTGTQLQTVTTNPTDSAMAPDSLKGLYVFDSGSLANTTNSATNTGKVLTPTSNGAVLTEGAGWLSGGNGNDTLVGNSQGDTLEGGAGADSMSGGAGSDIYFVDTLSDRITDTSGTADRINVTSGIAAVGSTKVFSLRTSSVVADNVIETLAVDTRNGGDTDNYSLTGNTTISTTIFGGAGSDTLIGGNGFDALYAAQANNQADMTEDSLNGGASSDSYFIAFYGTGLAGTGTDQINDTGSASDSDTVTIRGNIGQWIQVNLGSAAFGGINSHFNGTIENLDVSTFTAANTLLGNGSDNRIIGGLGADSIMGFDGNDILFDQNQVNVSASTADTLNGGEGSDTYQLFRSNTVIVDSGGTDLISVNGNANVFDMAANASNGWIIGAIENIGRSGYAGSATLGGNELGNRIDGSNSADSLAGRAGNDTITAYGGADTLDGGADNDLLQVGFLDYTGGVFADTVIGGTGTDTLAFVGPAGSSASATTINMTGAQLAGMSSQIEVVDFKVSQLAMNLSNVTAGDIQAIVGNGNSSSLTIRIDANTVGNFLKDVVTTSAAGSQAVDSVTAGGTTTTNFYNDVAKTQLIAQLVVQAS